MRVSEVNVEARRAPLLLKPRFVLVASAVVILDLVTKHVVTRMMPRLYGMAILPPYVHISFRVNSGIFLCLFDDWQSAAKPFFLAGITLAPVLAIIAYGRHISADRPLFENAFGLIAGGMLGNFADRILHGAILDFIEVHVRNSIYYPTFNVADLAATAGVLILLILGGARFFSRTARSRSG